MKNSFSYLFFLTLASCAVNRQSIIHKADGRQEGLKINFPDSVRLIIRSTNLSEDMSSLSSNDDEVAVFIYNYSDSAITSKPVFSHYFILNKNKMADTLHYADKINEQNNTVLFFLLEIDSGKNLEDIEASVRLNYKGLISAYNKRDYTEIEKYIGDDDLMGIKKVENIKEKRPVIFEFNDIYKMDRFSYSITLE